MNLIKKRYFFLDIIRIGCALIIFGRHAHTMAGFSFGTIVNNLFLDLTNSVMTIFFVLSGFSIQVNYGGGGLTQNDFG